MVIEVKNEGSSLKVRHVNDVIMEVFTFAGFNSFLTIQQGEAHS